MKIKRLLKATVSTTIDIVNYFFMGLGWLALILSMTTPFVFSSSFLFWALVVYAVVLTFLHIREDYLNRFYDE